MKESNIIELEDHKRYILLSELNDGNDKYFMAAEVNEEEHIDEKKLVYLKLVPGEDGNYVELVTDLKQITKLSKIFKDTNK